MPKLVIPLSDTQIKRLKSPDSGSLKFSDGGGLYLLVTADGGHYWRMDYTRPVTKKRNTLAFGSYLALSLAAARERREAARRLLVNQIDPAEKKKQDQRAALLSASNTFESIARVNQKAQSGRSHKRERCVFTYRSYWNFWQ